jgi:hypothetical protein
MKKQILLIVMTLCAMSVMAVSLPTSSYKSFNATITTDQPYTLGTGTTFLNQSLVGAGSYTDCVRDEASEVGTFCSECCTNAVCGEFDRTSPEFAECMNSNVMGACMNSCSNPHLDGGAPLDAPTAFLLALIAAYGAVAVYRRRKVQEA